MTDFLDQKRSEINERLAELKPLVDEYQRLEAAASALRGLPSTSSTTDGAAPARRRPGRPRKNAAPAAAAPAPARRSRTRTRTRARAAAGARTTPRRKPGRRKGSGTRAAQALELVRAQPGISIPELAARMGIKQNYLYRVLPGLEQEGKVRKQGRSWHPKG